VADWGHIKISRKAYAKDPFWLEPRVFSKWEAWEDCIQMAAWQTTDVMSGGTVERLERGEILASIRFLAQRWHWGIQHTRTFLKLAQQSARISPQRETQIGTVYLLNNYEAYQVRGFATNTPGNTHTRTANGKHPTQQPAQIETTKTTKTLKHTLTEQEQSVVAHYRHRHPKRLRGELPKKTLDLLRSALQSYPVDDLMHAIDGNADSQFHRENNFMDLALVLRDTEHIDRYLALYEQQQSGTVPDEMIEWVDG
jgi:hypothetical protein